MDATGADARVAVKMQQSTIIGGAIAAGFLAYLAMTGRLQTYWALMTGGAPPAGTGGAAPGDAPKGDPEPTTVGPVWTWPLGGTGEDGADPGVEPDEPEPAPPVISAQYVASLPVMAR